MVNNGAMHDLAAGRPSAMPMLDRGLRWLGHQRWLRYGFRNRLLRWLRPPERVAEREFEVSFAGLVYPGRTTRLIDWIVYYYGAYELDELELMRALLSGRPRTVALDVGANVGHHTLYLASFCAEVHAFEPYAVVADSIHQKIRRNHLTHVHVHAVGLGEADQELDFFAPHGTNTGTGTFVAGHEALNNRHVGRLHVVRGDAYVATLALPAVDLVKVDVEGFELATLRGLRDTLRRHRPIVMLELSDSARFSLASLADLMALFPADYQVRQLSSLRHTAGVLGRRGCTLQTLQWHHRPLPGGYINLLLYPAEAVTIAGAG